MSLPVVGMGTVSGVGRSRAEMFANLRAGKHARSPMRGFDPEWYTASQLYEVDDRTDGDRPLRATGFLVDAIAQALADAGLREDLSGVPVLVGTGLRELRSVELWHRDGALLTAGDLHFGTALRERFGADDTHTFANACSAGLYALSLGVDMLASGEVETVVVAGTDSITESMFGVADRVQSVAPGAVRPFDVNRMGTILGEGAAAIVLRRSVLTGDLVHGWVRGVGVNCDAGHPTAPDPVSISVAMRDAHTRAGITPADVDLVMLHGTGTPANDLGEATAMREVFGDDVKAPLMTAIKSMTGHTSGASGLHGLVTALQSLDAGVVVPTVEVSDPIEEVADFRLVRDTAVTERMSVAQINAFGFGGVNAVAIVEGNNV